MRALVFAAVPALLAASGCLDERPEPPRPPDPACSPAGYHFAFLDTGTAIYRQGATVRVTPTANKAPFGTEPLPLHCTSDWTVSGPATLSADRTTLTIARDAPPGSIVSVGFTHAGGPVAARFRVVGRDEIVLTGRRSQQSVEGCDGAEPVGELEFGAENRFAVTFMPFETYRDYWGSYSFDPATGRLRMTVEGGNFAPPGLDLDGRAEFESGRLVLRDMFLGSRQGYPAPAQGCTYRF